MTRGSFSDRRHLVNGVSIPGLGFGTYKHGVTSATTVEMIRHAAHQCHLPAIKSYKRTRYHLGHRR